MIAIIPKLSLLKAISQKTQRPYITLSLTPVFSLILLFISLPLPQITLIPLHSIDRSVVVSPAMTMMTPQTLDQQEDEEMLVPQPDLVEGPQPLVEGPQPMEGVSLCHTTLN